MAEFGVASREAVTYVALPVSTSMSSLSEDVAAGFRRLDQAVLRLGLDVLPATLIRYRTVALDGPVAVDLGVVLDPRYPPPSVVEPLRVDALVAGHYAVADQRGPYAWIGGLTRELMTWADVRGMDCAMTPTEAGDAWECWYELYPEPPVEGAKGPEGPVEVCLLLAP